MQLKSRSMPSHGTRNYYKRVIKSALVDLLVIIVAYTVAIFTAMFDAPVDFPASISLTLLIASIMIAMLYVFGVYQRIWARTSGHGIAVIINAVLAATFITIPLTHHSNGIRCQSTSYF